MPKRLLFICYWSISDNLTIATVLPRLLILHERDDVDVITLVTIERNAVLFSATDSLADLPKVEHQPFLSGEYNGNVLEKIKDFIKLPKWLARLVKENSLNSVVAHGAPAGALAYKVYKKTKLPFYVSSFEPHACYMVESGVWSRYSLKYFFQSHWENKQKVFASGLIPVAESYAKQLVLEGVPADKVLTVPCSVNAVSFEFDPVVRSVQREKLKWQRATIGVYVGKFGGLYYQREAYQIFQKCFTLIPDFCLIMLTPVSKGLIEPWLMEYEIDPNRVFISSVAHEDVPGYSSAADFAFATFKPGPSKKYLSPVKIGEYWANGLPVLLTEGVGDESEIIKQEGGGALYDLTQEGSLEKAIHRIQQIIKYPIYRQEIPRLALKYRSPGRIKEAYDYYFGKAGN